MYATPLKQRIHSCTYSQEKIDGSLLAVLFRLEMRAVVSHMLGIPLPPNKRHINSCNICQLCFNSQSQAEAHYKGNKHARMVKGLESNKMKQKGPAPRDSTNSTVSRTTYTSPTDITEKNINTAAVGMEIVSTAVHPEPLPPVQTLLPPEPQPSTSLIAPTDSTSPTVAISTGDTKVDGVTAIDAGIVNSQSLVETAKKLLYCSLCKVGVNSLSQLGAHNSGTKHKMMMAARNGSGPIKAYPKPHFKLSGQPKPCSGLQDKIFHCQLCDVRVNSEVQLKQHISSRRHKDRAAGKPPKPKLSPLNKQQLNVATSAMLLPLQNGFQESIAARFLPNSLAATMTTASPSLSLRPAAAPTIFQAPQMVQHLLRPAPGPIRASHGPILFTPY
ncbi:zinc finger protein 385B-like [Heterodontus francisci]|uniref:zinc finger protein 385B-like n=1 Tax=Heterodontus francisci TaxID=7792 RepID=UPI00355BD1B3